MSAIRALCELYGINNEALSREENLILEAELFVSTCDALKEIFRTQYKNYFRLMNFTMEMENTMLDANFMRLIIRDILSTEEYTLEGIACYAATHEDVVHEVVAGKNTAPSATFLRRIIELHKSVRCEIYDEVVKKITAQYLEAV